MIRALRVDASGGPTGYIFRAKARGFIALRTKTWGECSIHLTVCRPHVSVTSYGARVASQQSPILRTGRRRVTKLIKNSSLKFQEVGGQKVEKKLKSELILS